MSYQCRAPENQHRADTSPIRMRMKTISVLYCILYAARIEGAEIYVEGHEGGDVSFRCSHKLAWKYDKYLCTNTCKGSENTLVTVQSGRRVESGRITLVDSGDGVFTVTFSQLQLSDSGIYWCAVDRPGFDTFTEIQLTVEKASIPIETSAASLTTVMPELDPDLTSTWTFENISNTTQSTCGTSRPANLTTASNSTNGGEENNSTGPVLYATVAAAAAVLTLLLAAIVRKRRENSKPRPQVCSNSKERVSADEKEVRDKLEAAQARHVRADCDYDDVGEAVQPIKEPIKTIPGFSCTQNPKPDPPAAAECSVPCHIYENIGCSRGAADSRQSAAKVPHEQDLRSEDYIIPLPPEKSDAGCDDINKPTATTNAREKSRSLWFGLDLSGTV